MSQLANASATSLNFVGFEDQQGQGMPEILFNQVFIEPNQSYTAGVGSRMSRGRSGSAFMMYFAFKTVI